MKRLGFSKFLSAAFVAGALVTAGVAPTFAQALSHDGSLLPHYFDKNGELKWGGWAPPAAELKPAITPSRTLYMYVKPHRHHSHVG
jgi:hypothetical protein